MTTENELGEVIRDLTEHLQYLKELGVSGLGVELDAVAPGLAGAAVRIERSVSPAATKPHFKSEVPDLKPQSQSRPAPRPAGSRLAELPSLKTRKPTNFFDKYNPREEEREPLGGSQGAGDRSGESAHQPPSITVVPEHADATETIGEIHAEIGPACTRCKLCELGRTQVVNSVGNYNADLMFCGEAPGADEDRLGEPFVGRAGQLLTDIIEKGLEIPRKDVFIGNINRCRPPGNRAPEEDESSVCKPFLMREIAVVRPKVIVTLGATATQNLLETRTPIGKLRGKFHDFMGTRVMPTFHPAYLLRDPNKKREVWEDMKLVREYLRSK